MREAGMTHEILIRTQQKMQVLDITETVAAFVQKQGGEGLCCVYVPHATAAIVINENADPNIGLDLLDALATLVPEGKWRHDRIDDNAAAHIKAAILGPPAAARALAERDAGGVGRAAGA
jgi:secondary thiamine-phosphate synthase enzyme